eukprot:3053497-Rhodomonas_salina.1
MPSLGARSRVEAAGVSVRASSPHTAPADGSNFKTRAVSRGNAVAAAENVIMAWCICSRSQQATKPFNVRGGEVQGGGLCHGVASTQSCVKTESTCRTQAWSIGPYSSKLEASSIGTRFQAS